MTMPGWQELLLIVVVLLFLFGGRAASRLGKDLGEFVKSLRDIGKEGTK
jgi:Sec-independent protein translocase protein TatA